jgi:hypothetical protein
MARAFPIRLPASEPTGVSTWILENCLPPFTEAWTLFENYWECYATWQSVEYTFPEFQSISDTPRSFTPFTRSGFVEQILSPLYHRSPDNGDKPLGHRLALLFMVFVIPRQEWQPRR